MGCDLAEGDWDCNGDYPDLRASRDINTLRAWRNFPALQAAGGILLSAIAVQSVFNGISGSGMASLGVGFFCDRSIDPAL